LDVTGAREAKVVILFGSSSSTKTSPVVGITLDGPTWRAGEGTGWMYWFGMTMGVPDIMG
jgi:hypothetical protein